MRVEIPFTEPTVILYCHDDSNAPVDAERNNRAIVPGFPAYTYQTALSTLREKFIIPETWVRQLVPDPWTGQSSEIDIQLLQYIHCGFVNTNAFGAVCCMANTGNVNLSCQQAKHVSPALLLSEYRKYLNPVTVSLPTLDQLCALMSHMTPTRWPSSILYNGTEEDEIAALGVAFGNISAT